jgi:hypothetical protein
LTEPAAAGARILGWIATHSFPDRPDPADALVHFIGDTRTFLDSREAFDTVEPGGAAAAAIASRFSPAMRRVLDVAQEIGSGPVRDGALVHDGLVASEFLIAALLVEGTGLGAEALTRASRGRLNSHTLLNAIGVHDSLLRAGLAPPAAWATFNLGPAAPAMLLEPWVPTDSLEAVAAELPAAPPPTAASNWLIPHRLLITEHPSAAAATAMVQAGVTLFVSLIGEYTTDDYRTRYPATATATAPERALTFHHLPIADFHVVPAATITRLVVDIQRALLAGHVVCVHCRGGHGRTGMVVVPLLCAVYATHPLLFILCFNVMACNFCSFCRCTH